MNDAPTKDSIADNASEATASDLTPPAATPQEKRDALRQKIEASERRIADRSLADQAKESASDAVEYTRQHPLTVVGGALALGLLIGLATPRGRRFVGTAATGAAAAIGSAATRTRRAAEDFGDDAVDTAREAGTEASRIGNLVSDAIMAFGMKLVHDASSAGRAGSDALEDLGDSAGARARRLKREASYLASSTADSGRNVSRRTRRKATRAMRDLKGKRS
ncbi:hypothetical protein [Erythrobacter sp.]|uniref:hypothetical protein n=1 Tax=Erythrobacter sp. TaxID=1042 RepID=UPI002EA3948B|nr:hypothetical protein [Erythrobacter sp.]